MSEEEGGVESEETPKSKVLRPENVLSRQSDQAIRPGFRNPANTRSKAQKRKKKKKR